MNEDKLGEAIEIKGSSAIAYCIADGMGGEAGGGQASSIAVSTVEEKLTKLGLIDYSKLFSAVAQNLSLYTAEHTDLKNMATTLSVCIFDRDQIYVGHTGDTRIYHLRGSGIMKRTTDQTELQELIDNGVLSQERAKNYPRKNVLTSALSSRDDHKLFTSQHPIKIGDRILLLSDGAYNKVKIREISEMSVKSNSIADFSNTLLATIEQREPTDDYSAISIEIVG